MGGCGSLWSVSADQILRRPSYADQLILEWAAPVSLSRCDHQAPSGWKYSDSPSGSAALHGDSVHLANLYLLFNFWHNLQLFICTVDVRREVLFLLFELPATEALVSLVKPETESLNTDLTVFFLFNLLCIQKQLPDPEVFQIIATSYS